MIEGILFLDLDNVLNSNITFFVGKKGLDAIDREKVQAITKVCQELNLGIAIQSGWVKNTSLEEVKIHLGSVAPGFKQLVFSGRELLRGKVKSRETYIKDVVIQNPTLPYLIIDDIDMRETFPHHQIVTNPDTGLTFEDLVKIYAYFDKPAPTIVVNTNESFK